ncbi:hypothetical protein D3C75_1102890 [compost metagenome]
MRDIITFLPFWEGFSVITIKPDGDALQIDLTPRATQFPYCGGCRKPCSTTHEYCQRVQTALSVLPKVQPQLLVMDEFELFKGHRYASVVLDADTRRRSGHSSKSWAQRVALASKRWRWT